MNEIRVKQNKLIPRQIIFGNPEKASPLISPDGKRMSYLAPVNNVLNVWVGEIGKNDFRPITKDTDRGIMRYFWSEDNRHILYLQDLGGNENWRLFSVEIESREVRDLTPFDNVQTQILDHNKRYPNELLLAMNRDNPELHDVFHLNLRNGELTLVERNPGNVIGWLSDANMKVRGALAATPAGGFDLLVRKTFDSAWEKIVEWNADDNMNSSPVTFTRDGNFLYLADSRDANAARLVKLNLDTGESKILVSDPEYDATEFIVHPDTYEIQAACLTKDRDEWIVLDESIREDLEIIRNIHRGDFSLLDRDNADNTWLIGFSVDDGPVPYYSYDRKIKTAKYLFTNRPALEGYLLAQMEPISFQSSDGLTIHGYLTFPPDSSRKNLSMVLNVHGGPWHRDTWGYNPEAQWMANRGYACLQVNFRGSTGYGKQFINAGDHEWGGKMHQDLVDAVQWAIHSGIADPERIAIYGGSYGGYASLVGATFTPDLFRCAISIVGPSNLISFIKSIPPYWSSFLAVLHKRLGHPENELDFLISRSPLYKVDQIRIPMLIAQGANDPRVKQAESEQIVDAMHSRGIPHEYLLFPDEGHGFVKPGNRLKFYAAAEKFLATHLGGRYEE
ncbi:MAG TPA: S9 family peptidase [Acidobacteriota bacterium]|nr:S9 family peptidase [Acidobacteriota bacterium]